MSDAAQLYQKLLNEAIHKQMTVLGPQITLIKVRNVTGLTITDDGTIATMSGNPEDVVTRFLEEFRDISAPLVKKTMQPLLSAIGPTLAQAATQVKPALPTAAPTGNQQLTKPKNTAQPKTEVKQEDNKKE